MSAHRFELLSKASLSEFGHPGAKSLKSPEKSPTAKDVAVVLNIERRESWWTDLSRGSWTRLVTNIVGKLRVTPRDLPILARLVGLLLHSAVLLLSCLCFSRCNPIMPNLQTSLIRAKAMRSNTQSPVW